MPRRRVIAKRDVLPDSRFNSKTVTRFVNRMMVAGKKSLAERILYKALDVVHERTKKDPLEVFEKALKNVAPLVEVKSRRVGGATYQVPVEVNPARAQALSMRWIIEFARKRGEKSMTLKLAGEIVDASDEGEGSTGTGRGRGGAIKKRDDTHRMADANKAFSHFRW